MSILVIAEHDNSNLKGATLNTVAAALEISDDISLLIAGFNIDSVIDEAKKISKWPTQKKFFNSHQKLSNSPISPI